MFGWKERNEDPYIPLGIIHLRNLLQDSIPHSRVLRNGITLFRMALPKLKTGVSQLKLEETSVGALCPKISIQTLCQNRSPNRENRTPKFLQIKPSIIVSSELQNLVTSQGKRNLEGHIDATGVLIPQKIISPSITGPCMWQNATPTHTHTAPAQAYPWEKHDSSYPMLFPTRRTRAQLPISSSKPVPLTASRLWFAFQLFILIDGRKIKLNSLSQS